MVVSSRLTTRREALLAAGALLAGCTGLGRGGTQLSDSSGPDSMPATSDQVSNDEGTATTVRAYVGSYHWGFFVLDENGTERERLDLTVGDELRLTLFNAAADAAVADLPDAVRAGIPDAETRARRNERRLPVPQGSDLETLHETAEATYPDHGLAIVNDEFLVRPPAGPGGPGWGWGGHHGPGYPGRGPGTGPGSGPGPGPGPSWWGSGASGLLAPPTYLWHRSTVPSELGTVVRTGGSFGFACTVYCGYGHPYMAEQGRLVVASED